MGSELHAFRPQPKLFATFDQVAIGSDPVTDSAILAEAALESPESVSSSALHEKLGWSIRRFNPALELAAANVGDGRVSRTYDPHFAIHSFYLAPEDRVVLKRYVSLIKA